MRKKIFIELLEEYEKVNIYSIRIDGESQTEFERFLMLHKDRYQKDIGTLLYRIQRISEDGVFERHFRYEGKHKDRVSAIPSHIDLSNLRVYCICLNERILILGNGGIKNTRTYNENSTLCSFVNSMQEIDKQIKIKEKAGKIAIVEKCICGELFIEIEDGHIIK